MCSRYILHHSIPQLAFAFHVSMQSVFDSAAGYRGTGFGRQEALETFEPTYNLAPSHSGVVIVREGERRFVQMQSGMVDSRGKRHINARSETVDTLPTFRMAFRQRRCLILMSGFYEPDHVLKTNDPYYFQLADGQPFAAAGIWECAEQNGKPECGYAIITVPACPMVEAVHDRMPAILDDAAQEMWLNPETRDTAVLKSMLKPYVGDDLIIRRVDRKLYKNLSRGPECIAPFEEAEAPNLFSGLEEF